LSRREVAERHHPDDRVVGVEDREASHLATVATLFVMIRAIVVMATSLAVRRQG
jgi:hypothetical protein